eukprot:51732-Pyramimonas_sp.AAC.1
MLPVRGHNRWMISFAVLAPSSHDRTRVEEKVQQLLVSARGASLLRRWVRMLGVITYPGLRRVGGVLCARYLVSGTFIIS